VLGSCENTCAVTHEQELGSTRNDQIWNFTPLPAQAKCCRIFSLRYCLFHYCDVTLAYSHKTLIAYAHRVLLIVMFTMLYSQGVVQCHVYIVVATGCCSISCIHCCTHRVLFKAMSTMLLLRGVVNCHVYYVVLTGCCSMSCIQWLKLFVGLMTMTQMSGNDYGRLLNTTFVSLVYPSGSFTDKCSECNLEY